MYHVHMYRIPCTHVPFTMYNICNIYHVHMYHVPCTCNHPQYLDYMVYALSTPALRPCPPVKMKWTSTSMLVTPTCFWAGTGGMLRRNWNFHKDPHSGIAQSSNFEAWSKILEVIKQKQMMSCHIEEFTTCSCCWRNPARNSKSGIGSELTSWHLRAMDSLCLDPVKQTKLNLVLQRLYVLGAPKAGMDWPLPISHSIQRNIEYEYSIPKTFI